MPVVQVTAGLGVHSRWGIRVNSREGEVARGLRIENLWREEALGEQAGGVQGLLDLLKLAALTDALELAWDEGVRGEVGWTYSVRLVVRWRHLLLTSSIERSKGPIATRPINHSLPHGVLTPLNDPLRRKRMKQLSLGHLLYIFLQRLLMHFLISPPRFKFGLVGLYSHCRDLSWTYCLLLFLCCINMGLVSFFDYNSIRWIRMSIELTLFIVFAYEWHLITLTSIKVIISTMIDCLVPIRRCWSMSSFALLDVRSEIWRLLWCHICVWFANIKRLLLILLLLGFLVIEV